MEIFYIADLIKVTFLLIYQNLKIFSANKRRIYDPVVGRFLNTDPVIQAPNFTQSYNAYSYCFNNPLKYSDPTGLSAYSDPWKDQDGKYHSIEEQMAALFGGLYNDLRHGYSGGGAGNPSSVINTLINSSYGGHWSLETGITIFESDAEAFLVGCIYFETNNYWGTFPGVATNFVEACSNYSKIKSLQNLTASLNGGGTLENKTPWMDIAIKEIGQTELIIDPSDPTKEIVNPRVQNYFTDGGFSGNPFENAWCAIFVNYCLQNAGIKGTGSPGASSFENWGKGLNKPTFGAIAVFSGHVGFVISTNGDNIYILGGNQSNKVYISKYYKISNVNSYRYPTMYAPSIWPLYY